MFGTYRAWWAREECRRASRSEPVAAVEPCSRTGRPTAESRKTPSDWRRKTVTCRRRTSRWRSGPRTVYVRLSNTIFQAKAEQNIIRKTRDVIAMVVCIYKYIDELISRYLSTINQLKNQLK